MSLPLWFLIGSLALSAVGMGVSSWQSNRQQNKAFEQQEDLLSLQNQYSIDAENRANSYNNPQAQMQRLSAAGINPNAAAQAIAGGSVPSQSYNSGSAPNVPTFDSASLLNQGFMSMAGSVDNFAYMQAQIKNLDSSTNLNNANANEVPKTQEAIRNELNERCKKYVAESNLTEKQTQQLQQTIDWAIADREKNVQLLENAVKQSIEQVKKIKSETENIQADTDVKHESVDLMQSQEALNQSQSAVNEQVEDEKRQTAYYQRLVNDMFSKAGVPPDLDFSKQYVYLISTGKYDEAEKALQAFLSVNSQVTETVNVSTNRTKKPTTIPELIYDFSHDVSNPKRNSSSRY